MSAQTVIRCKDGKTAFNIMTQSYVVGLYTIVYSIDYDTLKLSNNYYQNSSLLKEDAFHKKMRKQAEKNGDTVVEEASTHMSVIIENAKAFWKENAEYDDAKPKKASGKKPV